MRLNITVDVGGAQRKIQAIVNALSDLKPALKQFNKYFRAKVQKRFDEGGPGWAPIKARAMKARPTAEAARQLADELMRRKLSREFRRARKRHASGKGTAESVERRYIVLKEFERLAAGGSEAFSLTDDKRLNKSVRGLRERAQRAQEKVASGPLGKIASSIQSKITEFDVTVYSEIPWAGAHNKGATVGHGAKLPKRTFLEIEDEDLTMLARLIEEQVKASAG